LIALRIDDAPLSPALEYFLGESHWVDARAGGMDAALTKLIAAIREPERTAPGIIPAGTPATSAGTAMAPPPNSRRNRILLVAGLAVVAVALGALLAGKFWLAKRGSAQQPGAVADDVVSEKSIAVLPFTDMSEKKDQEYFSDGLSEELIDMLTKIPELRVPARTSSFFFKGKQATIADIAEALRVAHVLEGSVRKSGNQVRITAQLIRVDSGYHLWSQTYDRQLDDIFKVQDEIAGAVVTALKVHLLPVQQVTDSHRTANADAYNQYLLGRNFYLNRPTRDGPHLAADAYHKAIELDPRYALAYAGLAEAESLAADALNDVKGQDRAMADAERAVALAPDLADTYGVRGHLRHVYSWDWAGAQVDFEKALALNPGNSNILIHYAELLATVGRLPAAAAAARKAIEIDPLSELASRRLGQFLYYDGQIAAARQAIGLALALNPESIYSRWHLGAVELLDGHSQQALDVFRQDKDPVFRQNGVALAQHTLGHAEEARAAIDELVRTNAVQAADYQIAEVYAWRGEKNGAFEWLDRAFARRDGGLVVVKVDPLLASLHDDPRYKAFLHKMNLE
jgi:TolB-like protein/tetratricopeptide (TPR) repeat protein